MTCSVDNFKRPLADCRIDSTVPACAARTPVGVQWSRGDNGCYADDRKGYSCSERDCRCRYIYGLFAWWASLAMVVYVTVAYIADVLACRVCRVSGGERQAEASRHPRKHAQDPSERPRRSESAVCHLSFPSVCRHPCACGAVPAGSTCGITASDFPFLTASAGFVCDLVFGVHRWKRGENRSSARVVEASGAWWRYVGTVCMSGPFVVTRRRECHPRMRAAAFFCQTCRRCLVVGRCDTANEGIITVDWRARCMN